LNYDGGKFLITGANGFVASYFIEYLNSKRPAALILGIDASEEPNCRYKNFQYLQLNLMDKAALSNVLKDFMPDYVVHLASVSSVSKSWKEPVESFQNNTNIFLNLIESIRELNIKTRILSVGSSEEYGEYSESEMPLKEHYELHPNNPYSVARVAQELLSSLYAKSYGLDIVITRSFNHIGPRQKDIFVIPSFVKQLVDIADNSQAGVINVGNIEVVRDFLDVRDVVEIYYNLLFKGISGEVYNVCSGKGLKLKEIIAMIVSLLNIDVHINVDKTRVRPNETMVITGDNSKIKACTGWEQRFSLEQTLSDMIDFQRKNRDEKEASIHRPLLSQ